MATFTRPKNSKAYHIVAGDPKREGYGNSVADFFMLTSCFSVAGDPKREGYGNPHKWFSRRPYNFVAGDPKREGYGNYSGYFGVPGYPVAGDPKREGYGNFKVSFLLCLLISLQVTEKRRVWQRSVSRPLGKGHAPVAGDPKEKGMATC